MGTESQKYIKMITFYVVYNIYNVKTKQKLV